MKIIIPARLGSKGLPHKNRTLFKYTADIIPDDLKDQVWVTTDDSEIVTQAERYSFNVVARPDSLANDTASIRDVVLHVINSQGFDHTDLIVLLYLTYPQRKWSDVLSALDFFMQYYDSNQTDSLLCRKEVESHPYLCLQERGPFGTQVIPHDLYRRQDYPKFFELSHYIAMFFAGDIYNLNRNMYSKTTVFYPINDVIDVDTIKDLNRFNGK